MIKPFYTLLVKRTAVDEVATYSDCELWRHAGPNGRGICLYRQRGIENSKLRMAAGEYIAKRTRSPRFSREAGRDVFTWEIMGVMDGTRQRVGLRIHPVNFARDLLGCLAFGLSLADIDKDGILDLTNSRAAHRLFDLQAEKAEELTVVITDPKP